MQATVRNSRRILPLEDELYVMGHPQWPTSRGPSHWLLLLRSSEHFGRGGPSHIPHMLNWVRIRGGIVLGHIGQKQACVLVLSLV